ncbi:hypothetical protein D3C77_693350 [compost metagenome]
MTHGFVQLAMVHQPVSRIGMKFLLKYLRQVLQALLQDAIEQRVRAIPGFSIVSFDLRDEEMIAFKSFQAGFDQRNGGLLIQQHSA